jgi:hypothetical protein
MDKIIAVDTNSSVTGNEEIKQLKMLHIMRTVLHKCVTIKICKLCDSAGYTCDMKV